MEKESKSGERLTLGDPGGEGVPCIISLYNFFNFSVNLKFHK